MGPNQRGLTQLFSPGTITAVALYLPVHYLIIKAAFKEGYLKSYLELFVLFLAGTTCFTLFELIGAQVLGYTVMLTPFYYIIINKIEQKSAMI